MLTHDFLEKKKKPVPKSLSLESRGESDLVTVETTLMPVIEVSDADQKPVSLLRNNLMAMALRVSQKIRA